MKPLIGSEITPPLNAILVTDDAGLNELSQFIAKAEPVFDISNYKGVNS